MTQSMFVLLYANSLSLFTSPNRATCEELLREYKACESPEYITYVRCVVPPWMIRDTNIIDRMLTLSRPHNDLKYCCA